MSSNLPPPHRVDRYVFIGDQGSVCSSATRPMPEDFAQARVGIVTIIDTRTNRYYAQHARWLPIPAADVVQPELDGLPAARFHAA